MNLKKVGVVSAIAGLFASAAYAQDKSDKVVNIIGSIRAEAAKESSKTDQKDAKETATFEGFRLQRARVQITGAVAAGAANYSLIIDPLALGGVAKTFGERSAAVLADKTSEVATANDPDGANDSIKEALISHKLNKMFTLKFGRTNTLDGSLENSYSGYDQYFLSWAQHNMPMYNYLTTGAIVEADFLGNEEHIVRFQVANGLRAPGTEGAMGGMTTALQYEGKFMGMVRPIVSVSQHRYTRAKSHKTTTAGLEATKYDPTALTSIALGAQLTMAGLAVDLEYDMATVTKTKKYTNGVEVTGANADKNKTYNGIILQAKYELKEVGLTPWLKVTSETYKLGMDQNAGDVTYMLYGLGADYWAVPGKMKYYLAYGSDSNKQAKGNTAENKDLTTTTTKILLGAGTRF